VCLRALARAGSVALVLFLFGSSAIAHPGRLDKDGCHDVRQRYVSPKSQVVLDAGTRHCHRRLGEERRNVRGVKERGPELGLPLDGSQLLENEDEGN